MAVVLIVARSKYMRKNNKYMRIYLFRTESRYNMKLQAAVPGLKTVFNDKKKTYPAVCLVVSRSHRDLTLYRTVRFKERIQCSGRSEFTGPRESANILLY